MSSRMKDRQTDRITEGQKDRQKARWTDRNDYTDTISSQDPLALDIGCELFLPASVSRDLPALLSVWAIHHSVSKIKKTHVTLIRQCCRNS